MSLPMTQAGLHCPFPFEACQLNLDHFLLASLDAVRDARLASDLLRMVC